MTTPAPVKKERKKPTGRPVGVKSVRNMLSNGLTPFEEAYCRARALGMNQREAIQMAGGRDADDKVQFAHIENRPHIKARLTELVVTTTNMATSKLALDKTWVIERLMQVTERCMQAEPVLDNKGKPTGEYKFDAAGANRSLELLGKEIGMFASKAEVNINHTATLTTEQLTAIARELALETGVIDVTATLIADESRSTPS
jgi:phage terminase small subunit